MAKAQEAAPGLVEYAQRTITDLAEEVERLRGLVEADAYKAALTKLVERIWAEFGTDLTEGDNDLMDMAYVEACGVLHIDPDQRTDEEKVEAARVAMTPTDAETQVTADDLANALAGLLMTKVRCTCHADAWRTARSTLLAYRQQEHQSYPGGR